MMSPRPSSADVVEQFAGRVATRIDDIARALQSIDHRASGQNPETGGHLGYFIDATRELLLTTANSDALSGAGYAADYADRQHEPAMIWWARHGDSIVERSHSVDPQSESFYDYASLRWFKLARSSGQPTLSGPFIDTWGSNDYTVTVSVPVADENGFHGVLAADVDVRRFIDSLTVDLTDISDAVALVNETDRVIVSTIPTLSTGLPIRPRIQRHDASPELRRLPVSHYGWSVVTLAT